MTDRDSGLRKAAILIRSIDEQAAASMMEAMDSDLLEALNKEISRLGDVKTEEKNEVMEEFRNIQVMESSSSVSENTGQKTDGSFSSDSTPVTRVPAIVQDTFQAEGQTEEDFLFQNSKAKLSRGKRSLTYGAWATKHGFLWSHGSIPEEWYEQQEQVCKKD